MRKGAVIGIACVILFLIGCATVRVWTSTPSIQKTGNDFFDAVFQPQLAEGQNYFSTFRLTITNKTDKDMQIDWVKTRYLHNGQERDGFAFEGITKENINNPPSDTVSPGQTFSKTIYPITIIGWQRATAIVKPGDQSFSVGVLPEGENGILLIVKQAGKEIREKITLNLAVTQT